MSSIAATIVARSPFTKSGWRAISPTVGPLGRIAAEMRLRLFERGLKMRESGPMGAVLFGRGHARSVGMAIIRILAAGTK